MTATVVVADQSPVISRQIASVFTELGYQVVAICHDGISALERVREFQPTVVTLDILLPRLGGIQLASAIRRSNIGSSMVCITSVSARERVQAARMLGVVYYALKPLDIDRLRDAARALANPEEVQHAAAS